MTGHHQFNWEHCDSLLFRALGLRWLEQPQLCHRGDHQSKVEIMWDQTRYFFVAKKISYWYKCSWWCVLTYWAQNQTIQSISHHLDCYQPISYPVLISLSQSASPSLWSPWSTPWSVSQSNLASISPPSSSSRSSLGDHNFTRWTFPTWQWCRPPRCSSVMRSPSLLETGFLVSSVSSV